MSGNSIGNIFRVTTWGESHGPAIGVIIDGCPPTLPINEKDIQKELDRRKPKLNSKISTTRREKDKIKILSGVFENKTLGTPISIMVENKDIRSKDYSNIKNIYRPGHADITYDMKYGIRDYRGGGRASGRETIARVIAGAIAKTLLKKFKTEIIGHTIQIGDIKAKTFNKNTIEKNEIRCADPNIAKEMIKYIGKIRKENDSVGAIVEIIIKNPPPGLGDPVFNKLDADLAKAMVSIGSIKGVEIGAGFKVAELKGNQNNDQIRADAKKKIKFSSNNSGGILGGISTGQDIILRLAVKPVPSIGKKQKTTSNSGKNTEIEIHGRHDTCLAPRIIPVAESMAAIIIADKILQNSSIQS